MFVLCQNVMYYGTALSSVFDWICALSFTSFHYYVLFYIIIIIIMSTLCGVDPDTSVKQSHICSVRPAFKKKKKRGKKKRKKERKTKKRPSREQ